MGVFSVGVKVYTRRGDDGTTGLFGGGRVSKDGTGPEAYGTVDEAVAALGVARSHAGEEWAAAILHLQREMFVVAAELATGGDSRSKLVDGVSRVTAGMVQGVEVEIDRVVSEHGLPSGFVVPGNTPLAAALDVARTVVRRAERRAVRHAAAGELAESRVVEYLNRAGDYLYVLARAAEGSWTPSRSKET